ncbi:hypothetical protein DFS33DRAFT_1385426 [Desarmillaria ectypa]|nr:hypothetical protein DFS33DRAFT_1388848 [Desarmillaria ectypa]KAK0203064.1 hypothetical protein DFS33DRAFT_1385426 [Desarmillaria ectypa]
MWQMFTPACTKSSPNVKEWIAITASVGTAVCTYGTSTIVSPHAPKRMILYQDSMHNANFKART